MVIHQGGFSSGVHCNKYTDGCIYLDLFKSIQSIAGLQALKFAANRHYLKIMIIIMTISNVPNLDKKRRRKLSPKCIYTCKHNRQLQWCTKYISQSRTITFPVSRTQ